MPCPQPSQTRPTLTDGRRQAEIITKVEQLGGSHAFDLTPQTTHLIVGEHDSEKYRHVAKERPDVRPMVAGWVSAVCNLWKNDEPIDFATLEKKYTLRPLETSGGVLDPETGEEGQRGRLVCCITGFEDRKCFRRLLDDRPPAADPAC